MVTINNTPRTNPTPKYSKEPTQIPLPSGIADAFGDRGIGSLIAMFIILSLFVAGCSSNNVVYTIKDGQAFCNTKNQDFYDYSDNGNGIKLRCKEREPVSSLNPERFIRSYSIDNLKEEGSKPND